MEQIKICPECREEYYAHISECHDCEVPLRWPEEVEKNSIEIENHTEEIVETGAVIKEDRQEWIMELKDMLLEKNVPSLMRACSGCSPGKCNSSYQLLVKKDDIDRANALIAEYFLHIHPEIKESVEWQKEGRCPACGHQVGSDSKECTDCGLLLVIEE